MYNFYIAYKLGCLDGIGLRYYRVKADTLWWAIVLFDLNNKHALPVSVERRKCVRY